MIGRRAPGILATRRLRGRIGSRCLEVRMMMLLLLLLLMIVIVIVTVVMAVAGLGDGRLLGRCGGRGRLHPRSRAYVVPRSAP